ncbi:class I SAM-dependent methyltransferase [Corynebacterium halotolerans]|uniref:Methyltransferase type 11 domain-containing protein n=1 Tax=Corynebacterium halotolerans YIM 70093 = DSM 44683 TaxID=1121362 RepID=M1NQ25_9CORY|nr:class I SAM-dependent methyltransferase [Corynebacterium halotolerans]AGF71597.1 hypothetical protein A605_02915 [Corynebacterium halotolerans YIM 70093 = DSM 44683]
MANPFTDGADYALHRPDYPRELGGLLAELPARRATALDVGCGTGQLTVQLSRHFDRVLGVDASAGQIDAATPAPGATYRVGTAEDLPVDDAGMDLITVAQAAHWLDLPAFYREVDRVAAPGAALALVSYGMCRLDAEADPGIDELYQEFYWGEFHRFWAPARVHVENGLADLPFPYEEVEIVCPPIVRKHRLAHFLGYVGTWSAAKKARESGHGGELADFARRLAARWGDPEQARTVVWPVTVRAGRVG